jgi:hypothetical protein
MSYAAGYDFRERFGDDPGEDYVDGDGGGLVRAIVAGTVTVLQWNREEYAAIPPEACLVDMAAKIIGVKRERIPRG